VTTSIAAFASEVLGFALHPRQAEIVSAIYREGIRTGVLRLGRRGGKGRLAAVVATWEATVNAEAHLSAVPGGEQVAVVVIGTSQRQARIVHRYIRVFLSVPVLAALVVRDTADEIELANGIAILTLPCYSGALRGLAVAVAIFDEMAWYVGLDGSPLDPAEIWRALVPSTAQFPSGKVLVLSTPRWASGFFYDLCQRAVSGEDPTLRHWHASTAEMNPSIPASFLDRERLSDPVAFAREYEAEFEASVAAVFDADLVRAAIRDGPEDLPPRPDISYLVATDPAFTGDRFAVIVGHREEDGLIVVDRVTSWTGSKAAPVIIDATLDAIATMATTYNGARVLIDQYAAEPIRQGLRRRGILVEEHPWTNESKVDAVAAVRRALYAARLSLPRHKGLISELGSLEQRPTPSGRPRIAAPGRAHDDYAMGLLALVADLDANSIEPAGASIPPTDAPGRPHGLDLWQARRIRRWRATAAQGGSTALL